MNRREFVGKTLKAAIVGSVAAESSLFAKHAGAVEIATTDPKIFELRRSLPFEERPVHSRALDLHRFGANYTPSKNWWFCWNNWDADPIKNDLDAIAALGADPFAHFADLAVFPAESEVGESAPP